MHPLRDGGVGPPPLGRVVQVDPIKPNLTPPGTERLKLESDKLPSSFGFKFNLRRHHLVTVPLSVKVSVGPDWGTLQEVYY